MLFRSETNAQKKYTKKLVAQILNRSIRCVVATVPAIKLGANLNPLNLLHLTQPVGDRHDLEQLVGRIRRRDEQGIKKSTGLVLYQDAKVPYLNNVYARVVVPVLRKLKVPGYENVYVG